MTYTPSPNYKALQKRLEKSPQGAPASEALFKIIEHLFTEKEAKLVSQIPINLFSAKKAAKIWNMHEKEAKEVLNELADKGLLLDIKKGNNQEYILAPTMAGFFEFSIMRTDGKLDRKLLSELYHQYINVEEDFIKQGNMITALQDLVLGVKDIGYADEHGLELLVETSGDLLAEQEIIREKKLMEKFFNMLGKEKDKTAYGKEPVEKALTLGAVDKLFLSKKLKKSEIKAFEKKASETGVEIEMVSIETEEGEQFWNLSGIGAILRFKVG